MENLNNFNFYGNKELLNQNSHRLGIVGSRSIINYTKEVLDSLFQELKNHDFCIVSGGMYGVDMFAHNLALEHGLKTIIILPQGIESYMKSSLFNQLRIKSDSEYLFISEYPDNYSPRKHTFLQRNKLISNISEILLIAQASLKSGSISTANHALKTGKKLSSIPISLEISQFQGTNYLIEKGAQIYLNPNSILKNFGISDENLEDSIINLLQKSSLELSQIQKSLEVNTNLIKKSVLNLILEGKIFYDGERYFL